MSRRRVAGFVAPSQRGVALDVYDPGGHRLVRLWRYWSATEPTDIQWERHTLGRKTLLADPGEEVWSRITIGCKTCRDRGAEHWFDVDGDEVRSALHELWLQPHDTPRSARLVATTAPIL